MRSFILILIIPALLVSCRNTDEDNTFKGPDLDEIEASILKVNRYILKRNLDHIQGFIRRTGWEMEMTGTGLFYNFLDKGTGGSAQSGNYISLEYSLKLIDGTLISSSETSGYMDFIIGQGGVPAGLEEAVLMTRKGSVMQLILPPHLGYGNFGNAEAGIPPDAILLYQLHVLEIK